MRLTAENIRDALSYINPLGERELDLRGHQYTHIENMGAASADVECIDFTDNHIQMLGNFPLLPRLATLLLARNRIQQIQPALHKQIPNLSTLSLAENNIKELADLDPLGAFPNLTHLHIIGNPVAAKEHYRYWVIWRCSSVRFFDHQRVKDAERKKAKELFGTVDEPSELASKIMGKRSRTFDVPSQTVDLNAGVARVKLTDNERAKVKELIKKAASLEEMTRLENMLNEGKIPGQ